MDVSLKLAYVLFEVSTFAMVGLVMASQLLYWAFNAGLNPVGTTITGVPSVEVLNKLP